ncbi:MAG: 4Fe-4S dicluster domain-containing protein [Thermodesulfobacteriota bacterium]
MSRIVLHEDRCKGCLLCTLVCPVQIIAPAERFNQQGYKVVEVPEGQMESCKGCAFCAQICPDTAIEVYKSVKEKESADAS